MFNDVIHYIKSLYPENKYIPLHGPKFIGNEKKYLNECIDSTFVSSVGKFVDEFEYKIAKYTGAKYAIATSNGTSALHISLILANVGRSDEVITQPLTFVATCNAISYCGAKPIFIDVDRDTMGLSPSALKYFLENNTTVKNQQCINNSTGKVIKACVPMHTFGHSCRIDEIKDICDKYHIFLIEDAAESLGSMYKNKHTGTYGQIGVISFNGNKIITSGGGGCIITNDKELAKKAKHLTTTAKTPHKWNFDHDMVGYNYRMPNLNAALLVAQLENLDSFINSKHKLAGIYKDFFNGTDYVFVKEPIDSKSNYWINSIILEDRQQRDEFLDKTNSQNIMTRPIWKLMNKLPMYNHAQCGDLTNSEWLEERVVNIPSSVNIMNEIILIGGGGHCKSVIDVIEQEDRFKIAGIVGKPELLGSNILGYSVIGNDADLGDLSKKYQYALITVGQIGSPMLRIKLFDLAIKAGFILPNVISPNAYISKYSSIGSGTVVMHNAIVNASASIGDNCIINSKALIEHDCSISKHCHISTNATINGGVVVKTGCFIGSGATTKESITIEENSFVKAGSLVI